ncbi:MAG: sugar ABC transporter permease [Candidatus Vecturithrix sp.]|jgi:multiple sugar transport system permease protein/raffinose/stachyose/melibiose transport system permease protein|nr:sugar ABC transporter permease [Candidatus Vecturithrix sp.]
MTDNTLKKVSYAFLTGPAILIYASVIIFPIMYSFVLSFTEWSGFGLPKFIGFQNYLKMLHDPLFLHGLRNNFAIVGISVFGQLPIGFVLAYILYRKLVKFGKFFETMIFLPIVIAPVVVAILFKQFFSPSGMFTALVRLIKNNPIYIFTIFENKTWAILPILFVILWMYTGMYMIVFLANLQKIDPAMIEAAVIDGASEFQILRKVILPSMLGILFTTSVYAIAGSMKSFDLIWAMTGGGPAHYTEVIAIYMYTNTFQFYKYGFGSAVSMVIVVLSMGLVTFLKWVFERCEEKYGA